MPIVNVKVKLVGTDGNAWALMAKVSHALRKAGRPELCEPFRKEAMSGDYDNLLRTCMKYVDAR